MGMASNIMRTQVGLDGAAWLCDLIAKSERVARGVDAKGNKVTFEENLAAQARASGP